MMQAKRTAERVAAWAACALAATALTVATPGPAGKRDDGVAGLEALDQAFRFASAITTDEKDRTRAQQAVVSDYATIGALDAATARAREVEGWRGGLAYADIAAELAKRGERERAVRLIGKAQKARDAAGGWHKLRVSAHIAQAQAALGETDKSREIAESLATRDPRAYVGRAAATVALGQATSGSFDEAMATLQEAESGGDPEFTWWKASAYIAIAKLERLTAEQREAAFRAARTAADDVPGWRGIQILEALAQARREMGDREEAGRILTAAEKLADSIPDDRPDKAPLLAELGLHWARQGEADRARRILVKAERQAPGNTTIERPYVYAQIGSGYFAAGDAAEAKRVYDVALGEAESLVNARPRALALVAICRSMGREGVALDAARRTRLQALYDGLTEPW